MLAADDAISVGRTPSAWTTTAIANNQLKITYSVFNQQAAAVTGVSLTTTLQPGVTFVNASIAPVQNGQQLTWSFGELPAYGITSVDVFVTFPGAVPAQIDTGATAIGTADSTPVNDAANPLILRTDTIDSSLLAATPDANFDDRFIQAAAAMYDQDPAQIFQFLTGDVGYESYWGSLRGARGTLWSKAGNSLDEASLMIALLRASGVPSQYATGFLPEPAAQQLILSMFPEPARITGLVPTGATVGDPANDPALLAETQNHYWVQFNAGSGMQDADPTFASANLGDTFAPLGATFTEIDDAMRHKVRVQLDREMASTAAGLFGQDPLSISTVLDATFNSVDLIGRPLTMGHFVDTRAVGSPVFSSVTNTYSPYIAVGDFGRPTGEDHLVRGTDYQEVITNFPFGSQVLTGLFLKIELTGPDGPSETFERTLVDLIGHDVRTNGGTPNLNFSVDGPPTLSNYDFFTVNALPSKIDPRAGQLLAREVESLTAEASLLDSNNLGPDGVAILQQLAIAHTRLNAAAVFQFSDILTDQLAEAGVVRAYFDRPRIVITENRIGTTSGSDPVTLIRNPIDLRRDTIRVIVPPGQNVEAARAFRMARGFSESSVETEIAAMHVEDVPGQTTVVSTKTVFDAALAAGIGILPISAENISELDAAPFSGEAKARITAAVLNGKIVLVPERPVTIDGEARIAWYEVDPTTGENIAVTEDGGHQAIAEYTAAQLFAAYTNIGFLFGLVSYLVHLHNCLTSGHSLEQCKNIMANGVVSGALGGAVAGLFIPAPPLVNIISGIISLAASLAESLSIAAVSAVADPPLPAQFISPPALDDFNDLSGAGVATKTVVDPLFTLPFGGAQLPTVFRVGLKNEQATADRFTVQATGVPAGWEAVLTVPEIGVQAGKIGEVGLALRPAGILPPPGTNVSFTVTVTSTSNGAISDAFVVSFAVPEVRGIVFSIDEQPGATAPGVPVTVDLAIEGVGNMPSDVTFDVTLPSGLNLTGLNPIAVNPGQTIVQTITLTPAASAPLNGTLSATIVANFNGLQQQAVIPIRVAAPGADALASAITAAAQLDDLELAGRLNDLSIALTNLVQDPTNAVFKSQSVTALDNIIVQFDTDPLFADLVATLKTHRQSLDAATTVQSVQGATVALGDDLVTLSERLDDLVKHRFELSLVSNTAIAQPLAPSTFQLIIHNTGTETTTYVFSFDNLPADYDGDFSQASITLAPGESTPSLGVADIFATLTPQSASQLVALGFTIRVTAQGTPYVSQTTTGSITPRSEFVSVVSVKSDPPFATAGTTVNLSAQVLNAVNRLQTAKATFVVRDPSNAIIFTSAPVDVALTLQTSLVTVTPVAFDTTGLAQGNYSIQVTLTDSSNNPIPGGTGEGNLLIGSPVTAALAVTPESVPPGLATVTNSLNISTNTTLPAPFTLVGQVATTPVSSTIVVRGTVAYVAGSNGVDIVDVSNPAAPSLIDTFAENLIVQGGYTVVRELPGNRLVIASTTNFNANGTRMLVYSVADPLNPALLSDTVIPQAFMSDFLISGSKGILTTVGVFLFGNNDIGDAFDQFGDVTIIDFDAPGGPVITDRLEGTRSPPFTGNHAMTGGAIVNSTIAYVTSTTLAGNNFLNGTGQLLVVNYADPNNLVLASTLQVPGTVTLSHVGIDGNLALVVGSSRGNQGSYNNVDSDPSNDSGNLGNMTFTTLDISDPNNPVVVSTIVTSAVFPRGTQPNSKLSIVPVGGGKFAVSIGIVDGDPVLFLVDASDPQEILASALEVNAVVSEMTVVGGQLYTTSADGLLIYDIGNVETIPVTASVKVPKGTGVTIVPGSYNIPPTQIITGPDFDTLIWERELGFGLNSETITWQSTIANLQPGDTREVMLGGSVDFTVAGTPGAVVLSSTEVAVEQILGLDPETNTVRPGDRAFYTLNLSNPTANFVTYNLSVEGVPSDWVEVSPSVEFGPNSSGSISLSLTSEAFAALGSYGFVVIATTASGTKAVVEGQLTLEGEPVLPDLRAHGVVVSVNPTERTIGRGTSTSYVIRLTNTGSQAETFDLSVIDLPPGTIPHFEQNSIVVPPGASNFREITLTLTVPTFTINGDYQFTVTAFSTDGDSFTSEDAFGTLHVVGSGVNVEFVPTSGTPGSTYQLKVTNTGQSLETFDLTLAGPAALVATLGTTSVTLAPGASQMVPVTVNQLDFAFPGSLNLVATAVVHANTAVQDSAEATVNIAGRLGMTAAFDDNSIQLNQPGVASFILNVKNTGNLEDHYIAEIIGTTGPVSASLVGLDGQPTQSIPVFILPGLSTGVILLKANLSALVASTVTVRVRSLTDNSIVAEATANIIVPIPDDIGDVIVLGSVGGNDVRSRVKVIDPTNGAIISTFTPYGNSFHGGVRVATADLNKDGILEIITAPGAGAGRTPLVKVFDLQGHELQQYRITAYESSFAGGVYVAVGDVDGDGYFDIITTPGGERAAEVRVWRNRLNKGDTYENDVFASFSYRNFLAFGATFLGGATVAADDLNGDNRAEVVVGNGPGMTPRVRTFDLRTFQQTSTPKLASFVLEIRPFETTDRGGVFVAAGNIRGSVSQIIIGNGINGRGEVEIYRANGTLQNEFVPYPSGDLNAPVHVSRKNYDGGRLLEILTSQGSPGSSLNWRVWEYDADLVDEALENDTDFRHGFFVA